MLGRSTITRGHAEALALRAGRPANSLSVPAMMPTIYAPPRSLLAWWGNPCEATLSRPGQRERLGRTMKSEGQECNTTVRFDLLRLSETKRVMGHFRRKTQQNGYFVASLTLRRSLRRLTNDGVRFNLQASHPEAVLTFESHAFRPISCVGLLGF
jgi:hypothetical protein